MSITDWKSLHGDAFTGCRVLVTGGAGFIGSHLAHALAQLGARVVVLDDLSGGEKSNLQAGAEAGGEHCQFVEGSILDRAILDRCTADCRYVFHQAALPSVPRSIEDPVRFHEVNVTGTLHVLESARRAKVKRVLFAASSSAYGDAPTLPKLEAMPPLPKSPYAANKLAGEHLMRAYAACYELDTVSLRYFNIFGPRQNANSAYAGVIAAFSKALIHGRPPTIYGDGSASRDFTYVDNAVHANLLAARSGNRLGGEVVNIGCAIQIRINELAREMAQALQRPELAPRHEPPRPGDVLHSLADISLAQKLIGYRPIVEFSKGLQATIQWYQSTLKP